ncbi:MAG TPA: hypothetical protein PKY82_00685 [Pyrinomonadaceae bacterium]|nr:hypothetical protein [Pyrinomonadaceae bacterium]
MMFSKSFMYVVFLFIIILFSNINFAQESSNILATQIQLTKIEGESISAILAKIALTYNIPISFQSRLNYESRRYAKKKIKIPRKDSLRQILNELVKTDPDYTWEESNGIIRFFPKFKEDLIISELLETSIKKIVLDENPSKMYIGDLIFKTPEIKNKLLSNGITKIQFYYATELFNESLWLKKTAYQFENTKVIEILNRIIKESSKKFWIISRWGAHNEFITLIVK